MNTSLNPEAYLAIILPFHSPSTRNTDFLDPGGKTSAVTCLKIKPENESVFEIVESSNKRLSCKV